MEQLDVRIDFGEGPERVGNLLRQARSITFRYATEYLARGHNLSPLKLDWSREIQRAQVPHFDGLFGVFADALPDGWGRLLLDRRLLRLGYDLDAIDPLDRLALVGETGKGALTFHPTRTLSEAVDDLRLALGELAEQAAKVLRDERVDALPELLRLGGSSGGARPKIQVLYNPLTGDLLPDALPVPEGYQAWIIKFFGGDDRADAARTEYAYALAARRAGLEMTECRLFEDGAGGQYFGTRRFDRSTGGERTHLHSLAGLLHDNFRLPAIDYGHVMDAAFRLELDTDAYRRVLRLAAFNVFAHNRDDHSNNISFLMDAGGQWRLAPAYDLTHSRPGHGQHSLTVGGEGARPGRRELLSLATHFGMSDGAAVLDQVWESVRQLPELLREQGASDRTREELRRHLAQF